MRIKIKDKNYNFKPNKNTFYVFIAVIFIIILAISLHSCTKYNRKIRGEKYQEILVNLPEYEIKPCTAPDGTPTSDYFTIYPPKEGDKVIYLTFDDGPSQKVTPQILDTLKKYNVKATFFVIGQQAGKNPDLITRMSKEGHTIGNHTYSHNYDNVYSSPEAFMEEINLTYNTIADILGTDKHSGIFRFPGGAFRDERAEFKEYLIQNNIAYVNWNCMTGDSEVVNPVSSDLIARAKRTANDSGRDSLVLLMHDAGAKQSTADALPAIIEYFKNEGYRFDSLKRK